jgi:DNA-binding winged helix-turn-helix (wHTH) protein
MTALISTPLSGVRQLLRVSISQETLVIDHDPASIAASGIPGKLGKRSRILPVLVLIPECAIRHKGGENNFASKSLAEFKEGSRIFFQLDIARTWFPDSSSGGRFEFGEVAVNFFTMEIHHKGRLVTLTRKGFMILAYLINNAGRVISRDELLNQVWGYQCYPCTRTVDNHIWRLRGQLETEPARPRHFLTIHGSGYKFLP